MEVAGRGVRGPLAEAVRELWFLRGPRPARFERIFPMTDVHLIVNLTPEPYRVLDSADSPWRTLGPAFERLTNAVAKHRLAQDRRQVRRGYSPPFRP